VGIPVKLHWSFGLILFYVLYIGNSESLNLEQTVWFAGYVVALFFCVLLHEYGHALMARRYGVKTIDIILSPIGGLARLERIPKKPSQELAVAIAGPLVNVAIALVLTAIMLLLFDIDTLLRDPLDLTNLSDLKVFGTATIGINIVLFLFNLIPAFPMDGGRILRALLAIKLSRVQATRVASYIGQFLAACFIALALYQGLPSWGLIGLFVMYTARNEYRSVLREETLNNTALQSIVKQDYELLPSTASVLEALTTAEKHQSTRIVIDTAGSPYDLKITTIKYLRTIIVADSDLSLSQISAESLPTLAANTSIAQAVRSMHKTGTEVIAVIKNGQQLLGVVDRDILSSYL